jgi:hypothetical protein
VLITPASDVSMSTVRGIDAKETQSVDDVPTKASTSSLSQALKQVPYITKYYKELIEPGWNVPRLLPMYRVQPSEHLSAR